MNDITKIKPFANSGVLVDYAINSVSSDDCPSMAFIGYRDTIAEILGTLLSEYTTDIDIINMDEFTYNDLYRLVVDEDCVISVVPIKKDDGEYIMTDVNMQFISDEVSTKYVWMVKDKGYKYQVFTLDSDFEEEIDEADMWVTGTTETTSEITPYKHSISVEASFNGKPYDELDEGEKQMFDLMMDWGFFW